MSFQKSQKVHVLFVFLLIFGSFYSLCAQGAYDGYNFYAVGRVAYLEDMEGNRINTWTSEYNVMSSAYLLRDSSILFPCVDRGEWSSGGAQTGGRLQIIQWDGTVTWDYPFRSRDFIPHHDVEPVYYTDDPGEVPNVLVICYTREANFLGDKLVELRPTGRTSAEVVWEWNVMDHVTENGNGRPDMFGLPGGSVRELTHLNNVSYNRQLDQVIINVKHFYEVVVLDKSTTTQEAATGSGGRYGMGGRILYRWGNPGNYGAPGSQVLSDNHGGRWVYESFPGTDEPLPGSGNILVMSNRNNEILEIEPPRNRNGSYEREGGAAYGPPEPLWRYPWPNFNNHQGSVQRLPNGNTLICNAGGTIREVTQSGEVVWSKSVRANKFLRYSKNYFEAPVVSVRNVSAAKREMFSLKVNSSSSTLTVCTSPVISGITMNIYSPLGKRIHSLGNKSSSGNLTWSYGAFPSGLYIVELKSAGESFSRVVNLSR